MTHSTVALIERNEISPSVGSLRRMLDSFPMTLAEFFALDIQDPGKVFFSPKELAEVGIGGVSLLQVGHNLKGRPLQVLLERYPPGSETAFTPYAHDGEEGGVVIEGEIEATIGDQVRILKRFDGFLFPSKLPHRFRNTGKVDCVIVSACSPPV